MQAGGYRPKPGDYYGVPRIPSPVPPAIPSMSGMVPNVSSPGADGASKRVTVWNRDTKRKISGNAAPMEKNLAEYLRRHPECELYNGQDQQLDPAEKAALIAAQNRIAIWNKAERRRVSGNAAPSEKNLHEYLRKHPECEIYNGQDKRPGEWTPTTSAPKLPPSSFGGGGGMGMGGMGQMGGGMPSMSRSGAMPIPASKPSSGAAIPVPINMSIADMYTEGTEAPFATDPFGHQDVFGQSMGSLGKMSGRSLEDMMMGMSMDSTMEGMGGSMDLLSSSPGHLEMGSLGAGFDFNGKSELESKAAGGTKSQPMQCPMSPAQRIKRDRSSSMRRRANSVGKTGSIAGSPNSHPGSIAGSVDQHPAQRMRQGPGPGSVPTATEDVLGWSISPSMLDDEIV